METLVVIFLALVWACFAAKETTTNHLRGRELMADTVLMCYDDPYGKSCGQFTLSFISCISDTLIFCYSYCQATMVGTLLRLTVRRSAGLVALKV